MASIEDTMRSYYDREMADRAERPLGEERAARLSQFVQMCREQRLSSVVEVGCGAGRDGLVLRASGLVYQGLDFSSSSVSLCTGLGLDALQGSALDLPFADQEFDAGWSMSTLMHLPGDGLATALTELNRVVRSGGVVEMGVWGGDENREWTDEHGRYFFSRTDREFQSMLSTIGQVLEFATWSHFSDGGHYQWSRVLLT